MPGSMGYVIGPVGLAGFGEGESGSFDLTTDEQEAVRAATEVMRTDLVDRMGAKAVTPGEKTTIEEAIQDAARWGQSQVDTPWYRSVKVWTWVVGGVAVVGLAVGGYVVWKRTRPVGEVGR